MAFLVAGARGGRGVLFSTKLKTASRSACCGASTIGMRFCTLRARVCVTQFCIFRKRFSLLLPREDKMSNITFVYFMSVPDRGRIMCMHVEVKLGVAVAAALEDGGTHEFLI